MSFKIHMISFTLRYDIPPIFFACFFRGVRTLEKQGFALTLSLSLYLFRSLCPCPLSAKPRIRLGSAVPKRGRTQKHTQMNAKECKCKSTKMRKRGRKRAQKGSQTSGEEHFRVKSAHNQDRNNQVPRGPKDQKI